MHTQITVLVYLPYMQIRQAKKTNKNKQSKNEVTLELKVTQYSFPALLVISLYIVKCKFCVSVLFILLIFDVLLSYMIINEYS